MIAEHLTSDDANFVDINYYLQTNGKFPFSRGDSGVIQGHIFRDRELKKIQ